MIKQREYLFSVDKFKQPKVYTDESAIGLLLTRLLLMEPGTNPLHPDMGVGITKYRFTVNSLGDIKSRIQNQIATYLPCFPSASVELIENSKNHMLNIEITIDDVIYVYDSEEAPVAITLDMLNI